MMPKLNIQWILPDGRVGGRVEGDTFRVRGPLPGATIRAKESHKRGRTIEIDHWDPISPSPDAIPHPCPVQADCGGCDLGTLAREVRIGHLLDLVQRALRLPERPGFTPSPRTTRHRARVRLSVRDEAMGFRSARSHDLVEIADCVAAREEVAARFDEVRQILPIPGLEAVEIRSDGTRATLAVEGKLKREHLAGLTDIALNGRALSGDPTLQLQIAGLTLRCSPRSFYQVNLELNALLVDWVVQAVSAASPERVLDLYSGIGNLTLPIAQTGVPTVAVEIEGQATKDLRHNAKRAGLQVEIHTRDVARFDPAQVPFDVVVLDPPRAGAGKAMQRLLLQRPRRIVLVSCHVPSAARDIQPALKAGYRLADVHCFEMFVDTHHVETAVILERA